MRTAAASNRAILAMLALAAAIALVLPFAADTAGIVPPPTDRVIAVIDGIEVTQADWDRAAKGVGVNRQMTGATLEMLREMEDELPGGMVRDWITAAESAHEEANAASRDVRLLAGFMSQYALEADFREHSLIPTDTEVDREVREMRRIREEVVRLDGPAAELARKQYEIQIDAYGEDHYWSVVARDSARNSLALQRLMRELQCRRNPSPGSSANVALPRRYG